MALTDETKDIIDLNIDGVKKQRFRINRDPNSIIELNLADLSISDRLENGWDKLQKAMTEISQLPDGEDLSVKMNEIDKRMREYIDYIFDYPVSEVCCKGGTMYDPINGMFRYEIIIDALTKLYTERLNDEYKKLKTRVEHHTDKYTKKPASIKRK